jgi:hypothetical protein
VIKQENSCAIDVDECYLFTPVYSGRGSLAFCFTWAMRNVALCSSDVLKASSYPTFVSTGWLSSALQTLDKEIPRYSQIADIYRGF